jgi:hypothetical protein
MSSERQQSQPARRARALPGVIDPEDADDELAADVDVPAWAREYSVGDTIVFETPVGTRSARILGFSVRLETRGLPTVLVSEELQQFFAADVDVIAVRERDVVEGVQ